jgi:hypothetical protein
MNFKDLEVNHMFSKLNLFVTKFNVHIKQERKDILKYHLMKGFQQRKKM